MYKYAGDGRTYYDNIGWNTALTAVNDLIANGAMPIYYEDMVAVGDDKWFQDEKRADDFAKGIYEVCREAGMALVAGESPAIRYLIKSTPPVKSAPELTGCATGIVARRFAL